MDTNDIIRFVSDGFEKAKNGAAAEIYSAVSAIQDREQLPLKSHYPFGWIIYYTLHQSPDYAIKQRKQILARYLGLTLVKPHKLHSMILTEAIRLYKDASSLASNPGKANSSPAAATESFSLVRFMNFWDFAYLRPGDHKRKEHNGRQLPSTVEKLITHYVDELYTTRQPVSDQFMDLALQTLAANPSSDNLYAQCARLYEIKGDIQKAEELLREAVLLSSSKFYLWSRLADIVNMGTNPRHRLVVSLLYKSLLTPGPEEFKGKIHLKLAKVFADAGSPAYAMWELENVKKLYESQGWNLPRLYKDTIAKIPVDTVPVDPSPIYRKLERVADDFIYETLPDLMVTKTYHKAPDPSKGLRGARTAWRVSDSKGTNYWLQPAQFRLPDTLPLGSPLIIKVYNEKVVSCKIPE